MEGYNFDLLRGASLVRYQLRRSFSASAARRGVARRGVFSLSSLAAEFDGLFSGLLLYSVVPRKKIFCLPPIFAEESGLCGRQRRLPFLIQQSYAVADFFFQICTPL